MKKKYNVDLKTSAMPQGTPVAYGQIVEWKGKPQADVFWGGEGTLFDMLAEQGLLDKMTIPKAMWDEIPATIGKPVGLPLKDPKGFWVGTTLEPYGLIYQPKLLQRLGVDDQGLGRSAQPQTQRPHRPVYARPVELEPCEL